MLERMSENPEPQREEMRLAQLRQREKELVFEMSTLWDRMKGLSGKDRLNYEGPYERLRDELVEVRDLIEAHAYKRELNQEDEP
jgi:hypothetical protein